MNERELGTVDLSAVSDADWNKISDGPYGLELPLSAYAFREDCKCMICGEQRVAYLRLEFSGNEVREEWQCETCAAKGPFRGWFDHEDE